MLSFLPSDLAKNIEIQYAVNGLIGAIKHGDEEPSQQIILKGYRFISCLLLKDSNDVTCLIDLCFYRPPLATAPSSLAG